MSRAIDQKVAATESDEENKRELLKNEINQMPLLPAPLPAGGRGKGACSNDERHAAPALERDYTLRFEMNVIRETRVEHALSPSEGYPRCLSVSLSRFFPHPPRLSPMYNHASPLSRFFASCDVTGAPRYFSAFIAETCLSIA